MHWMNHPSPGVGDAQNIRHANSVGDGRFADSSREPWTRARDIGISAYVGEGHLSSGKRGEASWMPAKHPTRLEPRWPKVQRVSPTRVVVN